jgi:hypothetical protein
LPNAYKFENGLKFHGFEKICKMSNRGQFRNYHNFSFNFTIDIYLFALLIESQELNASRFLNLVRKIRGIRKAWKEHF